MAKANVTNDLEHFVNCGVCFCEFDEEIRKPKFLQCAHTICLKCLQEISRLGYITCPFCRKAFFSDSASLPNNTYALQMVKLKEEKLKESAAGASSLTRGSIRQEETEKLSAILKKRRVVQGQLDLIMKSITAVGDQVKKLQEENNVEMAELISVTEMTPQPANNAAASFFSIAAKKENNATTSFSLTSASTSSMLNLSLSANTNLLAQPLRQPYIFILKVCNYSAFGTPVGEIRIRPLPTFQPEFVKKLGEFCYKSPKNFSSAIDKAQEGVFVSISMTHSQFGSTLSTANQSTRITASKLNEVGMIWKKKTQTAVVGPTAISGWNFFLPLNPVNVQQRKVISSAAAELFGHIIDSPNSPNQTVKAMSKSKKSERARFFMTLESQ